MKSLCYTEKLVRKWFSGFCCLYWETTKLTMFYFLKQVSLNNGAKSINQRKEQKFIWQFDKWKGSINTVLKNHSCHQINQTTHLTVKLQQKDKQKWQHLHRQSSPLTLSQGIKRESLSQKIACIKSLIGESPDIHTQYIHKNMQRGCLYSFTSDIIISKEALQIL